MKLKVTTGLVWFFAGALAVVNAEVLPVVPVLPLANVPETWNNGDAGWAKAGSMTVASVRPGWTLQFEKPALNPNQLPGNNAKGKITASSSASSGRYVGDYSNACIDRISFDLTQQGIQSAFLQIKSSSGRFWNCSFPLPEVENKATHIEVSLKYDSATWGVAPVQGCGEKEFLEDLQGIVSVSLGTVAKYAESGHCTVENFKLIGPWERGPMAADGVALAWLELNGLPAADGQAGLDADSDGFNNRAEFLAGTNPLDANSKLVLTISNDTNGKRVLRWKREDYRNYTILEAESLTDASPFVEVGSASITSVGTENQCTVQDSGVSTKIYKVEIK
jgi:hypothetical protein